MDIEEIKTSNIDDLTTDLANSTDFSLKISRFFDFITLSSIFFYKERTSINSLFNQRFTLTYFLAFSISSLKTVFV